MKRFTRRLAIALAVLIGIVAFAPADANAKHRHHHRRHHIVHHVHGHHLHGHGQVSFAYYDPDRRPVYQDRRGYFYFGPRGGHIHFDG